MELDLKHRIGGAAVAVLCCLGLAACNSAPTAATEDTGAAESTEAATDTTAAPTTAAELLDASTETGTVKAIASWSLETSDMKQTITNTYDDAGNLTEQKNEGTVGDSTSSQTFTYTYDGNTPATLKQATDSQAAQSTIDAAFATPEYQASGDSGTLTLTATGNMSDSDSEFTFTNIYDLEDGGKLLTKLDSQSKATIPTSDTSDGGDVTSSETYSFDENGDLTALDLDIMGSSGTMTVTYDGDTATVSGSDVDQTWTLTRDADGLITKAVNEAAGATVTVTYTDIAKPTDFNRAVLQTQGSRMLGDCIYGVMGADLATSIQNMDVATDSTTTTTNAS